MSRTQPRRAQLNLSSSSISLSDSDEIEDVDEGTLERILAQEIRSYDVLDTLPPTPQRPTTRSRLSVSPGASSTYSTRSLDTSSKKLRGSSGSIASGGTRKGPGRSKRSDKDICKDLGIELDECELDDINREEEEDRVHVDNVIDDILNQGLGKQKGSGGKFDTVEEEKLRRQFLKLRAKAPLEINGDGRCAMLKEDVMTVRKTLESVNALISVLEKTRDKLICEDDNLVYTAPPVRIKKKQKLPNRQL